MGFAPTSKNHYMGEAGVHAVVSQLLLRGYNPARPLFDHGPVDDLYVSQGGAGRIRRVQVKSASIKWNPKTEKCPSTGVQLPDSLLDKATRLDFTCVAFWDGSTWWIAVFEPKDIRRIFYDLKVGSRQAKRPNASTGVIEIRFCFEGRLSPRVSIGDGKHDITSYFIHSPDGNWDYHFPIEKSGIKSGTKKSATT